MQPCCALEEICDVIVLIVAISSTYPLETLALSYFVFFISSSIVFNIEPQYVGVYDKGNIFLSLSWVCETRHLFDSLTSWCLMTSSTRRDLANTLIMHNICKIPSHVDNCKSRDTESCIVRCAGHKDSVQHRCFESDSLDGTS